MSYQDESAKDEYVFELDFYNKKKMVDTIEHSFKQLEEMNIDPINKIINLSQILSEALQRANMYMSWEKLGKLISSGEKVSMQDHAYFTALDNCMNKDLKLSKEIHDNAVHAVHMVCKKMAQIK